LMQNTAALAVPWMHKLSRLTMASTVGVPVSSLCSELTRTLMYTAHRCAYIHGSHFQNVTVIYVFQQQKA
jgi:hypothetical protein